MSVRLVESWLLTTEVKEEWVSLKHYSADIYLGWPLSLHCQGWSCPESSHMITIPAPSTSCTKPMFVLSALYPTSQSALITPIAFSMPLFHRWWNTVPKRLKEMFKVIQQRRCRTRTWTQALLLQGQCLSPHYSHGAYRTWMKLFLKPYFRIMSWP